MNEVLRIEHLTFEIRRSRRRKTIGITVERDASLIAHLPDQISLAAAETLIKPKLVWVHQKLASCNGTTRDTAFRQPEFVDGEGFYYLGRHYRLKIIEQPSGKLAVPSVRFKGDRLLFKREQLPVAQKRIEEYYTRAAHPYINKLVINWKPRVGVESGQFVRILDLGFRWGSCSTDGTLNFHWRIMQLPPEIIEYVVVHELAHRKVNNHSPRFWSEVRRVMPNFEARRAWLREKGGDV